MVCKSCGSEVSPYVTECPYCGQRLRKRAPRLEREGDEIKVRESRREKRRRLRRERRAEAAEVQGGRSLPSLGSLELGDRPVATIVMLAVAALLVVLQRAVPWDPADVGALVGPVGGEVWRYIAAPFVYNDLGALIVVGGAIAIFGSAVEARLGSLMTLSLILFCGTGSMLGADAVASLGLDGFLLAAGGNGVALGLLGVWLMLARAEARSALGESIDLIGVSVVAVVLLLVPLVEGTADPVAGVVGGLLGLALGSLAASRLSIEGV